MATALALFTTTDEIINIYKTASEHKKFIAELEETFMDEYNLLVPNISEAKSEANSKIYFKITNGKENHRGFQYKDGMNSNTESFIPSGCCSGGRIETAYMDKISTFNMDDSFSVYRASKTLDRLNKYIERGFTISNLDEFFVCIEKLFED
jgi:hypothetical protein